MKIHPQLAPLLIFCLTPLILLSCEPQQVQNAAIRQAGQVEDTQLDEISGIQHSALQSGVYFVHNDDGAAQIYALDGEGRDLGSFSVEGAQNRDWEDIALVPGEHGPLLVIADTGDNFAQHPSVTLYFVAEPEPDENGRFSGEWPVQHKIELRYPDGARDCESVSWDPASNRILLMSKRDKPAHLYGIDLEQALRENAALVKFLGTIHPFRAPTQRDYITFGARDGAWVSQPTGMDISDNGRMAAVISYRSLYLFERLADEPWETAFQRKPVEFEGPPSMKEEAVTFVGPGELEILITTEGVPAPLYRFRLTD